MNRYKVYLTVTEEWILEVEAPNDMDAFRLAEENFDKNLAEYQEKETAINAIYCERL